MGMFDGSGGDFDFHNYVDYKVYEDITKGDNYSSSHKNKKVKKQDEPKYNATILLIISVIIAVILPVIAIITDYHYWYIGLIYAGICLGLIWLIYAIKVSKSSHNNTNLDDEDNNENKTNNKLINFKAKDKNIQKIIDDFNNACNDENSSDSDYEQDYDDTYYDNDIDDEYDGTFDDDDLDDYDEDDYDDDELD